MAELNIEEPLDKEYLIKNYADLNFEEVDEELNCKRCSRVLIHNYRANCGHYFCRNCKNILTNGTGWRCPSCEALIEAIETNSLEIDNRVLNLQIHCLNSKYGCEEITSLKDLKSHHDVCKITKDFNLPVLIRGSEKISKLMDKLGEVSVAIKELRDEVLSSKKATDKRIEGESRKRNSHKKDLDMKFTNLDHKVNGIGSQLTETIQTFKNSSNLQLQAQINELSFEHQDIKKLLRQLKDEQNTFQSKITTALETTISDLTKKIRPSKPINILLMGESGSGKSTLINFYADYCKYSTFEESILSRDKCLINTKITVTNSDYEEINLTTGVHDSNECAELNQSSTKACKSYLFPINDSFQIRFIDTPGFVSTSGPKYDDSRVEDIISFLNQYEDLHALVIVMRGNDFRTTTKFNYCLQQILTLLHKSASPNIIFIFTRNTKIEDCLHTIKLFLSEIEKKSSKFLTIKSSKNEVFCFENKSFNNVIANRNGIALDGDNIADNISWNSAKTEFERFINKAIKLEPLHMSETMRLNEVRFFINDMNKVLGHLNTTVAHKQALLSNYQKQDNVGAAQSIEELLEILKNEKLMLENTIEISSKYVYNNAILYFNFAKHEYIKLLEINLKLSL